MEQENQNQEASYPSLYYLTCPKCSNKEFKILGTKGAKGASVGIGMAFGAIGSLVASNASKSDMELRPVQYQCKSCKNKFESLPLKATPEEILEAPCEIKFKRLSRFTGMAVTQTVWLNGVKMGTVGNGKEITFPTYCRHNVIFVTDQYGVAFKGDYRFEAESGGTREVRFKGKFV